MLQAVPGSTHGYDVVDHGRLSDELGGDAGFERLAHAMAEHGLGLVVDTVPNHMAVAGAANRWWWDVLEDGPASPYARCFDIDWDAGGDRPALLMPILGDHLGRVLEAGEIAVQRRGGSLVATYQDHEVPLSPASTAEVLVAAASRSESSELASLATGLGTLPALNPGRQEVRADLRTRLTAHCDADVPVAEAVDAELRARSADPDALEAILDRQSYRLASWRTADDELNYRRFFSITTLAGIRVEDEAVFEASHRLLGELLRAGVVAGLRIDHIDGLRDPAGYLGRLRAEAPDAYLVVEKILQHGEELPAAWPVAGTSGYDHLIAVNDLFVDPEGEPTMTARYDAFTGSAATFDDVAHDAKLQVMNGELAAETSRATDLLAAVCRGRRRHRDHTRRDLRAALEEVVAGMSHYRTYVVPGTPASGADRAQVGAALGAARARRPDLDQELLELIGRVLVLDEAGPVESELAVRAQQLSAPVMAKGVEDTAFYRYHRLVSLNEVGGEPSAFGRSVDDFHRHCARLAERWPDTMLTLSTHDTKRSVDVRSRIDLLSELPAVWGDTVECWSAHNEPHRDAAGPERATEMLLYQTLVGTWPIETDRVVAAMAKSTKEAKLHTSWTEPNAAYDTAVANFCAAVLADDGFVAMIKAFLLEHRIVELGRVTSLAQSALLVTAPGVPDLYQGTELCDESLVDPDNRRPVDHGRRAELLDELLDASPETGLAHLDEGGAKLWMLARLLRHRRGSPHLYRSRQYEPLSIVGPKARHAVAFSRGDLVVVVPRLLVGLGDDWTDSAVDLPPGSFVDVLTGVDCDGGRRLLGDLFRRFPVAVLTRGSS